MEPALQKPEAGTAWRTRKASAVQRQLKEGNGKARWEVGPSQVQDPVTAVSREACKCIKIRWEKKSKPSIKSSDDKSLQMGPMHRCSFCPISCYKGLKPQNCSQITHIYSELDPLWIQFQQVLKGRDFSFSSCKHFHPILEFVYHFYLLI